jgi:hypothetical protein
VNVGAIRALLDLYNGRGLFNNRKDDLEASRQVYGSALARWKSNGRAVWPVSRAGTFAILARRKQKCHALRHEPESHGMKLPVVVFVG